MGGAAVNAEPPSRPAKALPPAAAPKPQRTAGPAKNKLPKQLRDEDGQDYVMMEEPEFEPEPDNTGPRWTGPRNRGREDW